MERRTFFKALAAAAAALTAAPAAATTQVVSRKVAPTSTATHSHKDEIAKAVSGHYDLRPVLRECHCVGLERSHSIDGPSRATATYVYKPDCGQMETIDDEAEAFLAGMKPTSIHMEVSTGDSFLLDVSHLGSKTFAVEQPVYHIIVEWVGVGR